MQNARISRLFCLFSYSNLRDWSNFQSLPLPLPLFQNPFFANSYLITPTFLSNFYAKCALSAYFGSYGLGHCPDYVVCHEVVLTTRELSVKKAKKKFKKKFKKKKSKKKSPKKKNISIHNTKTKT
jgi:hypothetical protein